MRADMPTNMSANMPANSDRGTDACALRDTGLGMCMDVCMYTHVYVQRYVHVHGPAQVVCWTLNQTSV